jgi:hypothetical protein
MNACAKRVRCSCVIANGRDAVKAGIGLSRKTKTAALRRPFRLF